ncbi:MAG: hypothetical protein R3323_07580 [Wenzhouxiangellaceae bacterium]|nr:hypothetical protein [Wenzhouxiangellaceae bacterium]
MIDRGLLDLPGLVLGPINDVLVSFLPEPLALCVWALISAWLTMAVYRWTSNQDRLAELKPQVKAVQKKLSRYDGDFSGLMPLIAENFRLSGRHILLAVGPALLAGIPVLFVLVWVSNAYGLEMPAAGQPVTVQALPAGDAEPDRWTWRGTSAEPAPDRAEAEAVTAWVVAWPVDSARLVTGAGETVASLPPPRPTPVLHQRQWWNALIANPAGYLEDGNPAEAVYLDLPKKEMLPFGPRWMRGWEFLYFLLLIAGSLGLKVAWKIH